jgi:hypothetical protein
MIEAYLSLKQQAQIFFLSLFLMTRRTALVNWMASAALAAGNGFFFWKVFQSFYLDLLPISFLKIFLILFNVSSSILDSITLILFRFHHRFKQLRERNSNEYAS